MPAVSKAQQRFMGMVHAAQKGDMENPSPEVQKAADSMSDKDAKDYASTSHKGLPDKKENMITKNRLKEIVKEVMVEEAEYQAFFKKALEKAGKGINDMNDDEKKAFFNKIDTAWNGKGEKNEELTGGQHKLDVDKDGDIEGDDLADLRAGKKVDEASTISEPGAWVAYLSMTRGKKLLKTFDTARGAKQFLSKNVDKLLGGANVESVGIMTKKQWDEREAKYAVESVNEAANLKTIAMLFQNKGIKDAVRKDHTDKLRKIIEDSGISTKGVSDSELIKIVNILTNESVKEDISTELPKATIPSAVKQKMAMAIDKIKDAKLTNVQKLQLVAQVVDSLGIDKSQLGTMASKIRSKMESVNEAENAFPSWPPVLDKFNTKEIRKLEADYKASLDKSSALLKKQWELINKGYPSDFPWENYDKWPSKLKAEVEKLNSQIEKEREKHPAMFKKLMQARGTWR
ncbi:MAG: Synechococcus phage [Bacteroidota bacterium]|jgi:hypothetical protein